MVASSTSIIANLMVVGLFAESMQYGIFLLAFFITAVFLFSRPRRRSCPTGARYLYLVILFASFLVATTHVAITLMCTSDHIIGDLPSVDFLTVQTILYVTQVILALIVLLHRVGDTYSNIGHIVLPFFIILTIASAVAGYRAAYLLHIDNSSLGLALDPNAMTDIDYAPTLLGTYKNWIVAFTGAALLAAVFMNTLLVFKVFSCRSRKKRTGGRVMSVPRLMTSLLLCTGVAISLVLAAILPAHLMAQTGVTFTVMNIATPTIALAMTGLMFFHIRGWSFDAPAMEDDEEPLTRAHGKSSPRSGASTPRTARSPTGSVSSIEAVPSLGENEKRALAASAAEPGRALPQDPFSSVPPLAVVQTRQIRSAQAATAGQLSARPPPAMFNGMGNARRAAEQRAAASAQRGGSKLRQVVSADGGSVISMEGSESPYAQNAYERR